MAFQPKKFEVIQVKEEYVESYSNLAYCAEQDFDELLVNIPSSSLRTMEGFLALLNGKIVVTIKDLSVTPRLLALRTEHMKFARVSPGETISLEVFDPPSIGFDLATLTVDVEELMNSSSTPIKKITSSEFGRNFRKKFNKHVFTEYQSVLLRVEGMVFKCTLGDFSFARTAETGSSSVKRGMVHSDTKVSVEVSDPRMSKNIIGAYSFQGIFRKDLKMESIEAELMSNGIGGMTSQLMEILNLAFGSRMLPHLLAKRLKMNHVRGMLLYGPPGTGKTLIARTICKLLNNVKEPKIVNGPEIFESHFGKSEAKIRSLFNDAISDGKRYGSRSKLHIIIFDELDSIAGKRGDTEINKWTDKIVNQLLTMIDGVHELQNIFIIGTTNRKDLIDEALLRHGRIEMHIELTHPDAKGRAKILEIYTKDWIEASLVDEDVNLQEIANKAHGCSGATMAALVRLACLHATGQRGTGFINAIRNNFKLTMEDFNRALEIAMQGSREARTETAPSSTEETVMKRALNEHEKMKEEFASYKEEKIKLEKTVDALGAAFKRTEMAVQSSTEVMEFVRSVKEEMKKELASYKEEKSKLERTVDALGAAFERTEMVVQSSTEVMEIERSVKEEMKKELTSYKEEKSKLERTVDDLGAALKSLKAEVEILRGRATAST